MPLHKLQWFFPIAVTLHNCEEAIWMPKWVSRHAAQLPLQLPGTKELRFALVVLTLAAFAVTYLSDRKGEQSIGAYLMFGYVVAMLVNVFVGVSLIHAGCGNGSFDKSPFDEHSLVQGSA
jgi:hypothetical protein